MTEEHWFTSEAGILSHHRELREQAEEDYHRVTGRIAQQERDMIDALRKSKAKYAEPKDEGNELEPIYKAQDAAHEARYEADDGYDPDDHFEPD